jgi:hypothetical protein
MALPDVVTHEESPQARWHAARPGWRPGTDLACPGWRHGTDLALTGGLTFTGDVTFTG